MSMLTGKPWKKLGWAASLAAATVAIVLGLGIWPAGGGVAFAEVAAKLRDARTMKMTMTTEMNAGTPQTMTMEYLYKEPGLMCQQGMGQRMVFNLSARKAMQFIDAKKIYVEMDLSKVGDQMSQVGWIEQLRRMPDQATSELGVREVAGVQAQGFVASMGGMDFTFWVDAATGDPVLIEAGPPDMRITLRDFQFDVPLDDALFDMRPPEGYQRLAVNVEPATEKDLLGFLDFITEMGDGTFPEDMAPVTLSRSMQKLARSEKFIAKARAKDAGDATAGIGEAEQLQHVMEESMKLTRGMIFTQQLKPENEWTYVGAGIQRGQPDPICWWKPDGSENYRVIFGDLKIMDVPPAEMVQFLKFREKNPPVPAGTQD